MYRKKNVASTVARPFWLPCALAVLTGAIAAQASWAADDLPNSCPVDGCIVSIVDVKKEGSELKLTFKANYKPDMSRNHIHVWWGDNYTVQQVSNNAETVHKVKQGDWHPTADFPTYVTQSGASMTVRGTAKTLCVSAGDRNHDIIDVKLFQCTDVSPFL